MAVYGGDYAFMQEVPVFVSTESRRSNHNVRSTTSGEYEKHWGYFFEVVEKHIGKIGLNQNGVPQIDAVLASLNHFVDTSLSSLSGGCDLKTILLNAKAK